LLIPLEMDENSNDAEGVDRLGSSEEPCRAKLEYSCDVEAFEANGDEASEDKDVRIWCSCKWPVLKPMNNRLDNVSKATHMMRDEPPAKS